MDPQLSQRFTDLEKKVDATYRSSEKMRKYFKWTLIITFILFVLPLIGLLFAIPQYVSTLSQYTSLGL
ncbi:MAG: hypothetical protein WCW14_00665 [Candidatus Paceibacterota bacterium]|jgi:hypothetical protein